MHGMELIYDLSMCTDMRKSGFFCFFSPFLVEEEAINLVDFQGNMVVLVPE